MKLAASWQRDRLSLADRPLAMTEKARSKELRTGPIESPTVLAKDYVDDSGDRSSLVLALDIDNSPASGWGIKHNAGIRAPLMPDRAHRFQCMQYTFTNTLFRDQRVEV